MDAGWRARAHTKGCAWIQVRRLLSGIPNTMSEKTEVLVLGGYSAGKTHFGAQLLARLHRRTGELQLRGASPNLSLFDGALACLSEGRASDHTSSQLYHTLTIPTVTP